MNFNLFQTNNIKKLTKLAKEKPKFLSKKDEVDLFHVNKLNEKQLHLVFYISDEYQFGTKKSGERLNVPFNQYVNTFIFFDSHYFLIESINDKYTELISNYIELQTSSKIIKSKLNNGEISKIASRLEGFIKELEYSDGEEDYTVESMPSEKLINLLSLDVNIDFLLLNVEDKLISISNYNKISVNNSDEDYLIKFTGEIVNAIS